MLTEAWLISKWCKLVYYPFHIIMLGRGRHRSANISEGDSVVVLAFMLSKAVVSFEVEVLVLIVFMLFKVVFLVLQVRGEPTAAQGSSGRQRSLLISFF